MTLNKRRLRVWWARYMATKPLERQPEFRALLRRHVHQGLQVAGVLAAVAVVAFLVFRVVRGASFAWNELPGQGGSTIQLWDKILVAVLGLMLAALGRVGTGLRRGRWAMTAFVLAVGWFVVVRNYAPGNVNLAEAWIMLLLIVGIGTVPFRPWEVLVLGLGLAAEFWIYAAITPDVSVSIPRLLFLLLAALAVAIVGALLYGSRYEQYRSKRRITRLKNYSAARSETLANALRRERAIKDQLVKQENLASLGRVTAGVAHEIKNPLNFINNFASLSKELAQDVQNALTSDPNRSAQAVLDEVGDELEDLVMNTEKIAEHGWRADGIVKSMLDHSRSGPSEKQVADFNKIVAEYVGLAYHGARARTGLRVDIKQRLDETIEPFSLVPSEIGRVILNLMGNALDALSEQVEAAAEADVPFEPRIQVETRKTNAGAAFYLTDNGPGMPQDVAAQVFEPFFTTKPTGEGTGLGLSLAHEIVTQGHGGSLDVRSREGDGTVFSMILPTAPPPDGPSEAEPSGADVLDDRGIGDASRALDTDGLSDALSSPDA